MKLYLISQDVNGGYDTFDSAVVAAPSEGVARSIHPNTRTEGADILDESAKVWAEEAEYRYGTRAKAQDEVVVQCIGDAAEGTQVGIICASFNAG